MLEWLNNNPGASHVIAACILVSGTVATTILIIWREEIKALAKNIWGKKYKLSPRHIKWTTKTLLSKTKEKRVRAEYIDLISQTRYSIGELLILVRQLSTIVQTLITEKDPQHPDVKLAESITRLVKQTQESGKDGKFTPMYQTIADIDNIKDKILDKNQKWEGTKHHPRGKTKL